MDGVVDAAGADSRRMRQRVEGFDASSSAQRHAEAQGLDEGNQRLLRALGGMIVDSQARLKSELNEVKEDLKSVKTKVDHQDEELKEMKERMDKWEQGGASGAQNSPLSATLSQAL
eukprot:5550194-Pyramimonas_sp.AAC.1